MAAEELLELAAALTLLAGVLWLRRLRGARPGRAAIAPRIRADKDAVVHTGAGEHRRGSSNTRGW